MFLISQTRDRTMADGSLTQSSFSHASLHEQATAVNLRVLETHVGAVSPAPREWRAQA